MLSLYHCIFLELFAILSVTEITSYQHNCHYHAARCRATTDANSGYDLVI